MRAAVVTFLGINRERDMLAALARAGIAARTVWHTEAALPDADLVVLPGGFSYGDYLRAGAMAAHSPVMRAVAGHAARGGYVLAVCNGFQIATEAGLLPGALLRNATRRFIARDACVRVERAGTAFTKLYARGDVLRAPLAHGEGNYFADPATLAELEEAGRVAFRYCEPGGEALREAPNGSAHAIAGIFSENLRVLGLMPHMENVTEALTGGTDGTKLFEALAA